MARGTIKRLTDRGFGFIAIEGGKDLFFHMSSLLDARWEELSNGQAVEFDVGDSPKGPRAENVRTQI